MKNGVPKLLAILLIFGFTQVHSQADLLPQARKMTALLQMINSHYVDTVNNEKMVENAIVSVLENLDPHSVYIPKDELKRMNEPLVGNFEGIGIRFNILRDTIVVVSPISGGPSEKLGIRSGDKIIEIEDELFAGKDIKNSDVMKKLRGKKGTKVNISILRKNEKELIDYAIIRDKIPLFSVDASYMVTPKIGYIKVNRFARKTISEFSEKMEQLQDEGLKHLVLDLRGNGGGYLETAFRLADEFLEDDKLIVYTKGLKHDKQEYNATSRGDFEKGKLVILIDEGSASASEIVSGAIQDWDRGLIIGRKSFGKGLVQKPYMLPDGSAVRLTAARYYTPSGRCIQKPYDDGKKDYYNEVNRRFENGEFHENDSIKFPDSLKFMTNANRVVYGGGGIMPDVFVPLDTSYYSDYYSQLIRKGIFNEFTLTYLDLHREKLKSNYPSFKEFNTQFTQQEELLADLNAYAEKQKIEGDTEEFEHSKQMIFTQLKGLLAQNLWGTSEYYQVINQENNSFKKAIEAINDDTFSNSKLSYK